MSALCGGSGLVRAAGGVRARPQSTPPAAASSLLPQSADKSAQSKAFGETQPYDAFATKAARALMSGAGRRAARDFIWKSAPSFQIQASGL